MERDLIEMDIINAPEVLLQLKRRLAEQKIHTCLWNSLIIVNPFKAMP
jgi:myosin-5